MANEDSFVPCLFSSQNTQTINRSNFTQRERCDKRPKKCGKLSQTSNTNDLTSTNETSVSQGEEDPQGAVITGKDVPENDGDKEGNAYCHHGNNTLSDCLLQALCYWQEYLPDPRKTTSCFMQSSSSS